jgi:DNA gyrase/topoisomerase IV subunit A
MSDRTGLDAVLVSVLESLDEMGAQPDRVMIKSARVVEHCYETRGVAPRFGYDAICMAAASWLTHVRVVDPHGNFGSADPHDEAAAARYTEARLSRAGAMALASERGELPRLPIGLINGDLAMGGAAPAFDPSRIVEALRAASAGGTTDEELVEIVGPPAFPTGCAVAGDLDALAGGTRTKLRVSSDIAIEPGDRGARLLISRVPYGIGAEAVGEAIAHRVDAVRSGRLRARYPDLENALDLPLWDVRNESSGDTTRLVCELLADANADLCRQRLFEIWPVTIEIPLQLRAPLPTLVRGYVDDPAVQNEALASLLLAID